MEEDKYGHYQYYEIFQTYYKDQNLPENRCYDGKPRNITVKQCIEKFIDTDLGCHIPWHMNKPTGQNTECFSNEQFKKYVSLSNKLSTLDAKNMEKTTGCMRSCDRMEYKLWETTPLGMKAKYKPKKLKFSFIFSSGKGASQLTCNHIAFNKTNISGNYEMKEQYFIYNGNHLIADIGGFLSLLLGLSIFGILNMLIQNNTLITNNVLEKCFSCRDKTKIPTVTKDRLT